MAKEQYARRMAWLRAHGDVTRALSWIDRALVIVGYVAFPLLLMLHAMQAEWVDLLACAIVPAIAFGILSFFRHTYNARRPYEIYGIAPALPKNTHGHSFPSRHAFSLMMIACVWCTANYAIGCVLAVGACLLGALRVVLGVHFARDVIAGIAFALLASTTLLLI